MPAYRTRAACVTSEIPAPHSPCAVQTGTEHSYGESYWLCRWIQADMGEGLATGGTSHIKTAMMFDFQDKYYVRSLIKLSFNSE